MSMTFENAATKSVDVNGTNFVFREIGKKGGVPVVLLHHLTAVLEDWDPRVVDGLAAKHHVIAFDNRGVGGSGGSTPKTVEEMAQDAVAFIGALGFSKVDLFGFSLGGFVSQVIAQQQPGLVRKIILAGTGPAGGEGIANVGPVLQDAFGKAGASQQASEAFSVLSADEQRPGGGRRLPAAPERTHEGPRRARTRRNRSGSACGDPGLGDRVTPPSSGRSSILSWSSTAMTM